MSRWQISVDTGGTFTDCFCESPDGNLQKLKVLSNSTLRGQVTGRVDDHRVKISVSWKYEPHVLSNYEVVFYPGESRGEVKSLTETELIVKEPLPDTEFERFEIRSDEEVPVFATRLLTYTALNDPLPPVDIRLGTTRGTNALLERAGAPVVLITTRGFSDLLRIGNQQRPDLFALNIRKNVPFYKSVLEAAERLDASGEVLEVFQENEKRKIINALQESNSDETSVAIAFMHAYKNPVHEKELEEYLRREGFRWISRSSVLSGSSKILHRTETTVVNAYLSPIMNKYFGKMDKMVSGSLKVMTSAGHLSGLQNFHPKDGLLSGPAGGVKGAAAIGRQCDVRQMVTFDMGGTSTDVSVYDDAEDFAYETSVGGATIQAPCLAIDTIAAGGGSVCSFDGQMLHIGPESAGAYPGPACYGAGGPLTVTDINLLAGRLNPRNFSIPLDAEASENRLTEILDLMKSADQDTERDSLIRSLLQLTTEKMAKSIRQLAIRKGIDVSSLTLTTFGGAGGQHACDLAGQLGIREVLVPFDAGLLSAYGIRTTEIARFTERELLQDWVSTASEVPAIRQALFEEGKEQLLADDHNPEQIYLKSCFLYLRFRGQESTIEVSYTMDVNVEKAFEKSYRHIFGHWLENKTLEITSVKVVTAIRPGTVPTARIPDETHTPRATLSQPSLSGEEMQDTPVFTWETLEPGARLSGPALLGSNNCTVYLQKGWNLTLDSALNARLNREAAGEYALMESESANLALFTNRFTGLVEEMGAMLQRTSFSVNVKERVDFSCALLDADGKLVANAPHIPVHLGSMGLCVRAVMETLDMKEGDVVITNHPRFGGSHLPDITLISPVFYQGERVAFVANRAHHAEIGGKTPGSMPPDATRLEEEGVIFTPQYLLEEGAARWQAIEELLSGSPYPSRAPEENLADLRGALASVQAGVRQVQKLCRQFGADTVQRYMDQLFHYAGDRAAEAITSLHSPVYQATELLDDNNPLSVRITRKDGRLYFNFQGTAPVHTGNLNATPAIVRSVVLYTMRLMLSERLPLNEGLLRDVSIELPPGLLNPGFDAPPYPAVVGGNTEVSQRLTDTLLKALDLAACSYGTMNNIIFGNKSFGFYETICGGTGAGDGFHGCDAVHQHMTNTRITDPEIMEIRYPVRLEHFGILPGTGGKGKWRGGNGVQRAIRFLEPVELSVLTQHRINAPYGRHGGGDGALGRQWVERNGSRHMLNGADYQRLEKDDLFVIETPGGGGWGDQDG